MGRLFRGSLPLRVFAISVVIFAVPLVTYFLLVLRDAYHSQLVTIVESLEALGRSRAVILGRILQVNGRSIDIAADLMEAQSAKGEGDEADFNEILSAVQRGGKLSAVFLLSLQPDGRFLCTASSDPSIIGEDFSAFHFVSQTFLEGRTAFLSYGATELGRSLFVTRALDLEGEGERASLLVGAQAINEVIDQLVATGEGEMSVQISLVTADGVVFASGDPDLEFRALSTGKESTVTVEGEQGEKQIELGVIQVSRLSERALQLSWNGREAIGVEVPVHGLGMRLLLSAREQKAFQTLYLQIFQVMMIFVVIFAVGGWVALWLTERMARPFAALRNTMRRVRDGDLEAQFKPGKMGFEVNELGQIFNDTLKSLKAHMVAAEEERAEKERYHQELKIGKEIQHSLLPHVRTEFPGVEIAARYLPAREVGGDFYDVYVRKDPKGDQLLLTIADAAGKGVSACLYSLGLRSTIRTSCMAMDTVSRIMNQANVLFCDDTGDTGMFITAFTAMYNPLTRHLTYTSCGHTPAFIRRADNRLETLETDGLAMGVTPGQRVEERSTTLEIGDFLFMYTDGVTEAHNAQNELFGEARLRRYLESFDRLLSADTALEGLQRAVEAFMDGAVQHDDITVMVVKVTPS